MFFIATLWYFLGSSLLSTHQLGGFAGSESGASLQTFPGEYQRSRPQGKITVSSKDQVEPTEHAWGIELRSSRVTVLWVDTSSHVAAPSSPVFALPSVFAAISRRRESVWLEVHQSDTSRQPRWLDAQRECQSSLPGNLSGYSSSSFVCFVESGNYSDYGTMFSMLGKHPKDIVFEFTHSSFVKW